MTSRQRSWPTKMPSEPRETRQSRALEPELITDPQRKAEAEALNGLRQYDFAVKSVYQALERQPFNLRPSLIYSFQREALQVISAYAGITRPASVEIFGSEHEPPGAHLVQELVENLCDYVNDHWETSSAVHLAAYVMWRLNWIHPFVDGNGRTSRVLSFCAFDKAWSGSARDPNSSRIGDSTSRRLRRCTRPCRRSLEDESS